TRMSDDALTANFMQRQCSVSHRPAALPSKRDANEGALLLHVVGESTLLVIIGKQPPASLHGDETTNLVTQSALNLPGQFGASAVDIAVSCDIQAIDEEILAARSTDKVGPSLVARYSEVSIGDGWNWKLSEAGQAKFRGHDANAGE